MTKSSFKVGDFVSIDEEYHEHHYRVVAIGRQREDRQIQVCLLDLPCVECGLEAESPTRWIEEHWVHATSDDAPPCRKIVSATMENDLGDHIYLVVADDGTVWRGYKPSFTSYKRMKWERVPLPQLPKR